MYKKADPFTPVSVPLLALCLTGLLLLGTPASGSLYGQPPKVTANNELKINAVYLLAGFPEFSYERILGEETAAGVSVGFALDDSFGLNFGMFPYYRLFFGKKRAAGFFVEGNGAVYSESLDLDGRDTSKLGAGVGLAIGGKFLTKGGWVAELYAGAGRNFVNTDDLSVAYPRFGIQIGKRF